MKVFDLVEDFEPFHSRFQIENFVLARSGYTVYGCYKQALREMAARIPSLLQSCRKIANDSFHGTDSSLDDYVAVSRLEKIEIRDRIREFALLCGYAIALKEELGEFPQGEKNELEIEFWTVYTKCLMARDLVAEGRLTQGTVELLHSLPIGIRKRILVYLTQPGNHDELVAWYFEYEIRLPKPNCNGLNATLHMISNSLGLSEQGSGRLLAVLYSNHLNSC
jgi:hypothetical protein